jgi:hypothetical protein
MRRQAQVVQGSASKLEAVIAAGSGLVSFLLVVVGGFLLLVFLMRYLQLSLESLLGPQLNWLAVRVPDMSLGVWLVFFAAFAFLYGFFHNQKKRFARKEFGQNDNAAAVET